MKVFWSYDHNENSTANEVQNPHPSRWHIGGVTKETLEDIAIPDPLIFAAATIQGLDYIVKLIGDTDTKHMAFDILRQ